MTRIAVLHKGRCNPKGCGDWLCIKLCPVNRTGSECIVKGEDEKARIDESLCIGCGICVNRCPFEAISIVNLPEAGKERPVHRYGPNGFALYSLPSPVYGKVTGIIGRNGIGKSTAIRILAKAQKPNLGTGEDKDFSALVDYFKGTESQGFFEGLADGSVRVAYKPQNVGLIQKAANGKVGELLKKGAERRFDLDKVAENLNLNGILGRDISQVSGGELQRVAIAATVLKEADVYIFDEPTSFLDIRQRLVASRQIRDIAAMGKAVIVIEHDIIALDYMADLIHIMYGKEDVFGIVSGPKPVKAGINTYLEGFLKEENVRFRDTEIRFEEKPPQKAWRKEALVSWGELFKDFGPFKLKVGQGSISRHETVGILGENGIGKTSFVKMLAGVEAPDSGEIDKSIKTSYKPQFLDTSSDELVMSVLEGAIARHESDIVRPLNLKPLYLKKINELSGGEAQKVAIAKALSEDSRLVLLDEPSAYLDVEQRLIVSKIIKGLAFRSGVSILVVDHDLVFLDYLSERLICFGGQPAVCGTAKGPLTMEEGMNSLLKELGITLRRDELSKRPRINKEGSQKDNEQKKKGKYYYA